MLVPILLAAGFSPSDPKLTFSFIEHRPSPQKFQVSECTTDPPNGACGAEPKCIGGVTECKTNPVDTAKVKRWLPVHEGRTPDLLTTTLHVCEPEQPASAYSLYSQPTRQRYTSSLCQPAQRPHPRPPGSFLITDHKAPGYYAMCYASTLNHKSGTEFR